MSQCCAAAGSSHARQDPGLPRREAPAPLPPAAAIHWCEYCQSTPPPTALSRLKKKRKIIKKNPIVQFVTLHFLLQVKEFMCLCGVIFQCTDAWASCPHLSKYITSDAVSCDISTRPGGELFPWYALYTAFVCPRCLWRLKVERTNAVLVQALKRVDVMWFTGGIVLYVLIYFLLFDVGNLFFSAWIKVVWVTWLGSIADTYLLIIQKSFLTPLR